MTSQPSPAEVDRPSRLPLFYRTPEPLNSFANARWRLKDGDASFAAETPYVPIIVGELAAAACFYPTVFAGEDTQPLAVLGLERRNLFVEAGAWRSDTYVPAYVRRYPFGFIPTANAESFVLAIDTGSDRLVESGDEGRALFEDGKPSELTRQALSFCERFQAEAAATLQFGEALKAHDLLVNRRADITLPDGRKFGLDGFKVVDAKKFSKLSGEVVLEWHNNGYLAWVYFHLASLDHFRALLRRQNELDTAMRASQPADCAVSYVDESASNNIPSQKQCTKAEKSVS